MKNYEEEIRAKIDAANRIQISDNAVRVDMHIQEQRILSELESEFEFGRYDLQESDILRTLKIMDILETYPEVFKYKNALRIFYILARIDIILFEKLQACCDLSRVECKTITKAMHRDGLVEKHDNGEIELSLNGKSLASQIGADIFFIL